MTGWESLLNQFLQSLRDPAMITDLQGSIEFVNDNMLQLIGRSREHAVGQPFPYPWLLPQGHLDRLPWVNDGRQFEGAAQVESLVTDAEGNHRIINFSITALRGPDSRPQWLLSIGRDITPQRKAEELLEHLESDLTNVVQDMPAWVQLSRLDGTIEMVNEAACALSGYDRSEMVGQTWPYAWFPNGYDGENGDPFAELDRSGKILAFEAPCVTRQGESKTFGVTLSLVAGESGQPRRIMMVAHDMSERKRWEAELMQAEKIRAVSQLASGVAHDINNDLAVILGYSEYLLSKCGTLDDMERHALDAIQQQAQECAETVRRIQLFSRSVPKSKFAYCSVNDVVREVVTLTEPIWRSESKESWTGIQVETDLQWVPPVHAHLASLKEALTSLVNNAVAALPEGGTITLRTKNVGEDVMLEVSDTGVGIDSGHVGRIFDPFFTTKGPASSGLGLSIAYNLVTQMGGSLSLESEQGVGTTFTVRMPAAPADLTTATKPDRADQNGRSLDVLVVDDEPLVAGMLGTFLESVGHTVTVFLDGAEAVEAFGKREFDLVVVDLAMPGMDGWEVSRRIHDIRPGVPLIVATGWNITVEDGQDQGAVVDAVLRKPFAMKDLVEAIGDATKRRTAA